jgi:hypothetical protein
MARKLIDEGQFSLAVIVCHMACEVAIERPLSQVFTRKAVEDLKDPVLALLNGYNLGNSTIRKFYTALTGDKKIEKRPFWKKFEKSVKRRNAIIHGRLPAGQVQQVDTEESFKAASDLVAHLKQ